MVRVLCFTPWNELLEERLARDQTFLKHFSNICYPSAVKPILPVQDIICVESKTKSNLWKVVSTLL